MKQEDSELFFNDLRAALLAGVPIEIGSDSLYARPILLKERDLAVVGRQRSSLSYLDVSKRITAAAKVLELTSDMPLVLGGLSVRTQASRNAVRKLRWPITYVLTVLTLAWVGMILFSTFLLPELEQMHAEMALANRPKAASPENYLLWMKSLSYVFGIFLFVFLIGILFGGIRRSVLWIGGAHYVRSRMVATANLVARKLIGCGVDEHESFTLATTLVAADDRCRSHLKSLFQSSSLNNDSRQADRALLLAGERKIDRVKAITPALFVAVVGGLIALAYAFAVFAPIIDLLYDLAVTGV